MVSYFGFLNFDRYPICAECLNIFVFIRLSYFLNIHTILYYLRNIGNNYTIKTKLTALHYNLKQFIKTFALRVAPPAAFTS